ncbi:MAG: hypothetical protein ACKPKO_09000, partial [Candidatus Fonsibacter sp.]
PPVHNGPRAWRQFTSAQEVMSEIEHFVGESYLTNDVVCAQSVLHCNAAAKQKVQMYSVFLRGCIAKGITEKPKDPARPCGQLSGGLSAMRIGRPRGPS